MKYLTNLFNVVLRSINIECIAYTFKASDYLELRAISNRSSSRLTSLT